MDIVPGTNIVDTCDRDAATVWLDKMCPEPEKRFKFFNVHLVGLQQSRYATGQLFCR